MEAMAQGTKIVLHITPNGLQMEAPTGMPHAQIHWFLTLAARSVLDVAISPQAQGPQLAMPSVPPQVMRAIMESVKASQAKENGNGG